MIKSKIYEKAEFLIKKSKKTGADNIDVVYVENINIDVGCRLKKIAAPIETAKATQIFP